MPRSAPESKSARFEQYTSAIAAGAWPTSLELPVRDGGSVAMQHIEQKPETPAQIQPVVVDNPNPESPQRGGIGHNCLSSPRPDFDNLVFCKRSSTLSRKSRKQAQDWRALAYASKGSWQHELATELWAQGNAARAARRAAGT